MDMMNTPSTDSQSPKGSFVLRRRGQSSTSSTKCSATKSSDWAVVGDKRVPSSTLKSCLSVGSLAESLDISSGTTSTTFSSSTTISTHSTTAADTTHSTTSPTPPSSSPMSSIRKQVSFHQIEIREYRRTVSDHPSVSSGPPVGIDWNSQQRVHTLTVDDYEEHRPPRRDSFIMPSKVRMALLMKHGVTAVEIQEAIHESRRIQQQRRTTLALQEMEGMCILVESVVRKWKRFVQRAKASRSQSQQQQPQDEDLKICAEQHPSLPLEAVAGKNEAE